MKLIKTLPMTLMEVLISLGLLSALLFTLLTNFKNFSTLHSQISKLRNPVLERKYFHEQMTRTFALTDPKSVKLTFDDTTSFSTLLFTYQAGVDPNPVFAGWNNGKIQVTDDHTLTLITTSLSHPDNPPKELPLLHNVSKLVCNLDVEGTIYFHVTTDDLNQLPFAFFLPDKNNQGFKMKSEVY